MEIKLRTDFDIGQILQSLNAVGAVSFPLLSRDFFEPLLEEAKSRKFKKREAVVGSVRQDIWAVDKFHSTSLFCQLRNEWQKIFYEKLAGFLNLFISPLVFNEISLQRYELGSAGISPHMDGKSYINLICILTLTGGCQFCVCKDRKGSDPIYIDERPGNMILMRASGFNNSDYRPFHFVSEVQGPRITVGFRQKQGRCDNGYCQKLLKPDQVSGYCSEECKARDLGF